MRLLPQLEARRPALEKCVFCPKLCRTACPVSNAEPRETLTPWGKMTSAWLGAHGDVPLDDAHARPVWACTDCGACTSVCEHRNPVGDVLVETRDALRHVGLERIEPDGARRGLARFHRHEARTRAAAARLATRSGDARDRGGRSKDALLVGCVYLRGAPREAERAVRVVEALTGARPAVLDGCCGAPLRLGGDRRAFAAHAARFAESLVGADRLFVLDPGCARTLRHHYALEAATRVRPAPELLVEVVAAAPGDTAPVEDRGPVRWHDPCQMGRGLGVYDPPRAVLGRVLRRPPDEFVERRAGAACSGAGGFLPATWPGVARGIAEARLDAHLQAGGGRLVTGCGSSLIALRRAAGARGVEVEDLVSWMLRAMGDHRG
jgi:Fe-S oxidoreductase